MSTPKKVRTTNIFQRVISIVKLAKEEILVTMDISEELKQSLPLGYFSLLNEKMQEGVIVKRLAFGTKSDFEAFNKKYQIKHKNYKCVLAKSKNYKRMILVDRKRLFFAIDTEDGRNVFFTTDLLHIKKFVRYFFDELRK